MRYFKYNNTKTNRNNALKKYYLSLTKKEKNIFYKKKFLSIFSAVVAFVIFVSCFLIGIYVLTLIPKPRAVGRAIIYYIGMSVMGIILLDASGFLAYGITLPLWKKIESYKLSAIKKEILAKACAHLREYYQLAEPYIVTKCYSSTDEKFINHDVCIFVVGDELRITTDLIKGFLHGERDLGCYALKKEDINLSKKQGEKYLIAELIAKDTTFLLGYRAKSFIDKFLNAD